MLCNVVCAGLAVRVVGRGRGRGRVLESLVHWGDKDVEEENVV